MISRPIPSDLPPPLGSGNDPAEVISHPNATAVVQKNSLGISSNVLQLQVGDSEFVNVVWQHATQTTGVLRVESVVSLQAFADVSLIGTSGDSGASVSELNARADGALYADYAIRRVRVGSYDPGTPFGVRMDHDLEAQTYTISIDNELDGFEDDPASDPVERMNAHIPFTGVSGVLLGLLVWGPGTGTAGYDDFQVVHFP